MLDRQRERYEGNIVHEVSDDVWKNARSVGGNFER